MRVRADGGMGARLLPAMMRGMRKIGSRGVIWRERAYPDERWRRPFVRAMAQADVFAPDGRSYRVRVVRLLWPPRSGSTDLISGWPIEAFKAVSSALGTRVVWGVRVLGESTRSPLRPLIYGEEVRDRGDALLRAREIAEGLSRGERP